MMLNCLKRFINWTGDSRKLFTVKLFYKREMQPKAFWRVFLCLVRYTRCFLFYLYLFYLWIILFIIFFYLLIFYKFFFSMQICKFYYDFISKSQKRVSNIHWSKRKTITNIDKYQNTGMIKSRWFWVNQLFGKQFLSKSELNLTNINFIGNIKF